MGRIFKNGPNHCFHAKIHVYDDYSNIQVFGYGGYTWIWWIWSIWWLHGYTLTTEAFSENDKKHQEMVQADLKITPLSSHLQD